MAVTPPATDRTDPVVQLTTLPGWRQFVAATPSIPNLFTEREWLGLTMTSAPRMTRTGWSTIPGWW